MNDGDVMYDICIIGAGVIGSAVARILSQYKLSIIVLEKENDVCEGTSMANSGLVHSGYDPKPGTLKAKLNVLGNKLMPEVCKELGVELKQIGSITVGNDLDVINELHERGNANGVETIILDQKELHQLEPNLNEDLKYGLLAPSCAIINPFEYTVGLMENAMDNGVELALNNCVESITKFDDAYEINTNIQSYLAKIVINCAGLGSGNIAEMVGRGIEIIPKKGEYYVLGKLPQMFVNHTIFPLPTNVGKGVLITPTTSNNYLVGPSNTITSDNDLTTDMLTLDSIKEKALKISEKVPLKKEIRVFAGLRASTNNGDFIIEEDKENKGFINVLGIDSPGLASSYAIGLYVKDIVNNITKLEQKDDYIKNRRPFYKLNALSNEERNILVNKDKRFGNIICRCEKISEGEIVDTIHRNCGATTIRGVKKRVRPGFGKCQGGFCEPLVLDILHRELNIPIENIKYSSKNSHILIGRVKEDN